MSSRATAKNAKHMICQFFNSTLYILGESKKTCRVEFNKKLGYWYTTLYWNLIGALYVVD
jgi:hypothetical protein